MYTTGQVLKILNISRPTLYKICKRKKINTKKIGGNYRYSEEDLKKLLDEQGIDTRDIEEKFVDVVNDVWLVLKKLAEEIWGIDGEERLKSILSKNRNDIFILNITSFKEIDNV